MRLPYWPLGAFLDIRPSHDRPTHGLQPDGSPSPRSEHERSYLSTSKRNSYPPPFKTVETPYAKPHVYCRFHHDHFHNYFWTCAQLEVLLSPCDTRFYERNIKIKLTTTDGEKTGDNDPSYDCVRGLVQEKPARLLRLALARRIKAPPARDWNAKPEDSGRDTVNGSELEVPDGTELGDKPVLPSNLYETHGKDGLTAWKSGPGRSKEWRRSSSTKRKTRRQRCRDKEHQRDQGKGGRRPADPHQVARQEPVMMLKSQTNFERGKLARRSKRGFSPRQKHFELEEDDIRLVQDIQDNFKPVQKTKTKDIVNRGGFNLTVNNSDVDSILSFQTKDFAAYDYNDEELGDAKNDAPLLFPTESRATQKTCRDLPKASHAAPIPQHIPKKTTEGIHQLPTLKLRHPFSLSCYFFRSDMDWVDVHYQSPSPRKALAKNNGSGPLTPPTESGHHQTSKRKDGRKPHRGIHGLKIPSFLSIGAAEVFLTRRWDALSSQTLHLKNLIGNGYDDGTSLLRVLKKKENQLNSLSLKYKRAMIRQRHVEAFYARMMLELRERDEWVNEWSEEIVDSFWMMRKEPSMRKGKVSGKSTKPIAELCNCSSITTFQDLDAWYDWQCKAVVRDMNQR
ncbi:hypothetical protein EDB80DRAFT_888467 [Ilyonectria destructans]|nr:hypothetical protein EDB80DRAFT_888467 [Ilyonectria destructans]